MTCPICTNKPANCDCTQEAKELYYLRDALEQAANRTATAEEADQQRRRDLFERVALRCIKDFSQPTDTGGYFVCELEAAKQITNEILTAADKFVKGER